MRCLVLTTADNVEKWDDLELPFASNRPTKNVATTWYQILLPMIETSCDQRTINIVLHYDSDYSKMDVERRRVSDIHNL
jgi:hypothetical protein